MRMFSFRSRAGLVLLTAAELIGAFPFSSAASTPAQEAALHFMRGINLGNYLEAPPNTWGTIVYTEQDFAAIRNEGFDHVRIPVGWHFYTGPAPAYTLSSAIFSKVDFLATNALKRGLGVIINLHNFEAFTTAPGANTNKFYAIWRQVAAHYASWPATVGFELLNEPRDAATTRVMNPIHAEAIRQIRLTNPGRTILAGTGNFNSIDDLPSLTLPPGDQNIIATVHCYEPFYFTHQGAEWALPDTATTGVIFPGPPAKPLSPDPSITHSWVWDWFRAYNTKPAASNPSSPLAFRPLLTRAKQWSNSSGRPVLIGEFGCYEKAEPASRVRFYAAIRAAMDEQGLGWAMWDWKAGFHYIKNGQPDPPGMREALFPPLRLESHAPGQIQFQAAAGKTFAVEELFSFRPPLSWQPISTQTLSSPRFFFEDHNPLSSTFYRVRWLK